MKSSNNSKYKYEIERRFGNDYVISGNEYIFHCPFCPDKGHRNNDRKLYVNSNNGNFICFRCNTKGYIKSPIVGDYLDINSLNTLLDHKHEEKEEYFNIPKYHVVDYPNTYAYEYLINRGITPDLMNKYSMRAFGSEYIFKDRIVIPNKIINNNYTDIFTARTYLDNVKPRYFNSKGSNKARIVFNIDNIPMNPDMIIINEGVINSIIAGDASVAIYGKSISHYQLELILSKKPKNIFISLDYDAINKSWEMARLISKYYPLCNVYVVELPENKDACDLGHNLYFEYLRKAKKYYNTIEDKLTLRIKLILESE